MNSLSVEFDTYFNYDQLDYYENHVAVLTMVCVDVFYCIIFVIFSRVGDIITLLIIPMR